MRAHIPKYYDVIYSVLFFTAFICMCPVFLYRMIGRKKYRSGLLERLGAGKMSCPQPAIWVHSVSVGEAVAAVSLVKELMPLLEGYSFVFTATTDTGISILRKNMGGAGNIFYYPLDMAFAVARRLNALSPKMIIFMETELWPAMIYRAWRKGIPMVMINGRVSNKSYVRYRAVKKILAVYLKAFTRFGMQSEGDASRIEDIGAPADKIRILGNIKYSAAFEPVLPEPQIIRKTCSIDYDDKVFVCGSTHGDEEAALIKAFGLCAAKDARLKMVVVPRHPERAQDIARTAGYCGLKACLQTSLETGWQVLVVDTVGELRSFYALADVVFVGKSLFAPGGGQNIIEPAALSKPVICGRYVSNFQEAYNLLASRNAIIAADVDNLDEIVKNALVTWDKETLKGIGAAAHDAVQTYKETAARYAGLCVEAVNA